MKKITIKELKEIIYSEEVSVGASIGAGLGIAADASTTGNGVISRVVHKDYVRDPKKNKRFSYVNKRTVKKVRPKRFFTKNNFFTTNQRNV